VAKLTPEASTGEADTGCVSAERGGLGVLKDTVDPGMDATGSDARRLCTLNVSPMGGVRDQDGINRSTTLSAKLALLQPKMSARIDT